MDADNLIRMANRIGQFFEAMPDRDEAMAGIANHIRKFWEPRMRRAMVQCLQSPDADHVLPIVREALQRHEDVLAVP